MLLSHCRMSGAKFLKRTQAASRVRPSPLACQAILIVLSVDADEAGLPDCRTRELPAGFRFFDYPKVDLNPGVVDFPKNGKPLGFKSTLGWSEKRAPDVQRFPDHGNRPKKCFSFGLFSPKGDGSPRIGQRIRHPNPSVRVSRFTSCGAKSSLLLPRFAELQAWPGGGGCLMKRRVLSLVLPFAGCLHR